MRIRSESGAGALSTSAWTGWLMSRVPDAYRRLLRAGGKSRGQWCCGWPGRTRRGATAGSTASWPASRSPWRHRQCGGYSKSAGINSAPRRDGPGWAGFPRSQAQGILAPGFFTADLLNGAKACVLAVIEHGTRRIRVLGATENPDPDLEPAPPDDRAARVRGLLRHSPAAPRPAPGRAAPPAARRRHRPGSLPRSAARPRWGRDSRTSCHCLAKARGHGLERPGCECCRSG